MDHQKCFTFSDDIRSNDTELSAILPQEVIQGAGTWGWLSYDLVITSVPTNRVLSETQELLFVTQHAAIVRVTDVIRVRQPLDVILVIT